MSGTATVLLLAGCLESDEDGRTESEEYQESEEATENEERTEPDDLLEGVSEIGGLEIRTYDFVDDGFGTRFEGVVINNTNSDFDYVEVMIVLSDENGQRTDKNYTNMTNLSSGDEWDFEIWLSESAANIDEYTIAVVDRPLLPPVRFD